MATYQELKCQLTLEEALQEYHKINSELLYDGEMVEDSQDFSEAMTLLMLYLLVISHS